MENMINKGQHKGKKHGLTWIQSRAQQAAHYYSATKLKDLQLAKEKYLEKIYPGKLNESKDDLPRQTKKIKKKKRKRSLATRKSQRSMSKKSMSQFSAEQSELQQEINEQEIQEKEDKSESELSQLGKYELKRIHQIILQFQKIIDNYLDYQFQFRKKRYLPREDFMKYLKTTRYGYFSEKYLGHLHFYNRHLYVWQKDSILCSRKTAEVIEERQEETKARMTRKYCAELMLFFN